MKTLGKTLVMKLKFKPTTIFFTIFFSVLHTASYAGFPIGKGRWLLSPMYSYYGANSYWDKLKVLTPYENGNGKFTSNYFGVYGGFGVDKNVDFIFNVPFVIQTYQNATTLVQNASMGDASLGFSYFFNNDNPYKHTSLSGSLLIPLYQNSVINNLPANVTMPYVGFQTVGAEVKLGFSGTNIKTLKNTYYDVEGGIRQYFSASGPTQAFFNATFGVPLDNYWNLKATLNGVNSNGTTGAITNVYGLNRDFSYLRFTFAAGYKISKQTSLWANVFTDISGRNIGAGHGFSLFAVIKF